MKEEGKPTEIGSFVICGLPDKGVFAPCKPDGRVCGVDYGTKGVSVVFVV